MSLLANVFGFALVEILSQARLVKLLGEDIEFMILEKVLCERRNRTQLHNTGKCENINALPFET